MPPKTDLPKIFGGKDVISGGPNPAINQQLPLFARKAHIEFPQRQQSADSIGEVEADDFHRYHIKGDAHGRLVRASEWICTHIAEEVHVGTPTPMVVERINGETVFGSRRIAGVSDDIITKSYLLSPTLSNIQSGRSSGLSAILSSIYALDMFLNNVDRHFGNYLSIDDNGTRRLYAFDFSRSLFWDWPLTEFPKANDNTRLCGAFLWQLHGFDQSAALSTLDRLVGLAPATIQSFINRMPSDWLPTSMRSDFDNWWTSGGRQSRIDELRTGITDGTII